MNKATLHYNIIKSILSSSDGYLGVATDNLLGIQERVCNRDLSETMK